MRGGQKEKGSPGVPFSCKTFGEVPLFCEPFGESSVFHRFWKKIRAPCARRPTPGVGTPGRRAKDACKTLTRHRLAPVRRWNRNGIILLVIFSKLLTSYSKFLVFYHVFQPVSQHGFQRRSRFSRPSQLFRSTTVVSPLSDVSVHHGRTFRASTTSPRGPFGTSPRPERGQRLTSSTCRRRASRVAA